MERQLAQEVDRPLVIKLRHLCTVCAFIPKLDIDACMSCTYMAGWVKAQKKRMGKLEEAGKNYKLITNWKCK